MDTPRPQVYGLLAGAVLAVSIILGAVIITSTWTRVADSNTITVTSSGRKIVHSDTVSWRVGFSVENDALLDAQKKLSSDLGKVESFLQANGLRDFNVLPAQVREVTGSIDQEKDAVPLRIGYRVNQTIEVHSNDVDTVVKLASESTELVEQGVIFATEGMDFFYSKAADVKAGIINEALQDARNRAEQIAAQGGRKLRDLRSAQMGGVQINSQYPSAATPDAAGGDTSTRDKTVTVTITATFGLR